MREIVQVLIALMQMAMVKQAQRDAIRLQAEERQRQIRVAREQHLAREQEKQAQEEAKRTAVWEDRRIEIDDVKELATKLDLPREVIDQLDHHRATVDQVAALGVPQSMQKKTLQQLDDEMSAMADDIGTLTSVELGYIEEADPKVKQARERIKLRTQKQATARQAAEARRKAARPEVDPVTPVKGDGEQDQPPQKKKEAVEATLEM